MNDYNKKITPAMKGFIILGFIFYFFTEMDIIVGYFHRPREKSYSEIVADLSFTGRVVKQTKVNDKPSQRYVFIRLDSFSYDGWTVGVNPHFKDFYEIYRSKDRAIYIKDSTMLLLRTSLPSVKDSVFSKKGSGQILFGKETFQSW